MRNYLKLSVVLPVVIGIITGAALPLLGAADDAPGLSLIGIVAAFLLMMWGVYNTGLVKRSLLVSIALICFGAGGVVMSVVLQHDGEFSDLPSLFIVGMAVGAVLLCAGIVKLIKDRKKV